MEYLWNGVLFVVYQDLCTTHTVVWWVATTKIRNVLYMDIVTLSSNFYYIYCKNKGIGIKITKLEELCLTANGRDNISIMIGGSTGYTNFFS
jgi:hypothetical protein